VRLASLPMYDLPELQAATDAWWEGLAEHLRAAGLEDVPDRLDRRRDAGAGWHAPELLLSQTCGYPLTHALAGSVRLVATPGYAAEGCAGPYYRSAIVVRDDDPAAGVGDLAGRRAAFNARHSHSGYNALRHALAPRSAGRPFLAAAIETGGHAASAAAVAEGRADFAALDAVSLALLARHRPAAVAGLRVLAYSAAAPGLPYVTHGGTDDGTVEQLRAGLRAAFADPELATLRAELLLAGVEALPRAAYDEIDRMEEEARRLGYPEIA